MDPVTIEADDGDFESAVLERSLETPVAVDFWAPWCGPCRTLGPLLERLALEAAPAFVLAEVNVDESPVTAQRWGIQSIPAEASYREALELEPSHSRALIGLAAVLGEQDRATDALALLERVAPGGEVGSIAERLAARLRTVAESSADPRDLRARLEANPAFADEAARKAMLDLFALLGPEHALTGQYRRDLARVLFR